MSDVKDHIRWHLECKATSPWLKAALASAQSCDPVALLNDLFLLDFLLRPPAEAEIAAMLTSNSVRQEP